jgi:hypothetical protein
VTRLLPIAFLALLVACEADPLPDASQFADQTLDSNGGDVISGTDTFDADADDVRDVQQDVPDVQADVPDAQEDLPDVHADVLDVQSDVADTQQEVSDVQDAVSDIQDAAPDIQEDAFDAVQDIPDAPEDVTAVLDALADAVPEVAADATEVVDDAADVVADDVPDSLDAGPCANITCDDGNPCTNDSCLPAGDCQFLNNDAPCDDGSKCTNGDTCANGSCVAGGPQCGKTMLCVESSGSCYCEKQWVFLTVDGVGMCAPDYPIWGIRVLSSASYFTNNGDGTSSDSQTGLMWQQGASALMSGNLAQGTCDALVLGGHSNWRLPTVAEMDTLIDFGKTAEALPPGFSNTYADYFWTACSVPFEPGNNWIVEFMNGTIGYYTPTAMNYRVRCVR